jgi:hypothetical protein
MSHQQRFSLRHRQRRCMQSDSLRPTTSFRLIRRNARGRSKFNNRSLFASLGSLRLCLHPSESEKSIMAAMRKVSLRAVCFALCLTTCAAVARAQEAETQSTADAQRSENYYYQQPNYQPNPRAIIHQKALARSAQRDARLASLNWYGMYNARPTAAPTPFTTLYSPVWQMPGGRPYAWYPTWRTVYVPTYR